MFWFACVVIDVNDDGDDEVKFGYSLPKFMVIGHRGSGMNILQSCDPRMKSIQENSILSFNAASKFPIDFIEFDVQVFPFFFFFFINVLVWFLRKERCVQDLKTPRLNYVRSIRVKIS